MSGAGRPLGWLVLAGLLISAGCQTQPLDPTQSATPTIDDEQTPTLTSNPERSTTPATPDRSYTPTPAINQSSDQPPATTRCGLNRSQTDTTVTTYGGSLSVNATTVFGRVQRITCTPGAPTDLSVQTVDSLDRRCVRFDDAGFLSRMDVECQPGERSTSTPIAGQVNIRQSTGGVVLRITSTVSRNDLEVVLAHEFAHTLQAQADIRAAMEDDATDENDFSSFTTDRRFAEQAMIEGGAEYVEIVYEQRYLNGTDWDARTRYRTSSGTRAPARYYFGARYIADRTDDPTELWAVYDSPARTSEQVIHGYRPSEEQPVPLTVRARLGSNWEIRERDTLGEITVRIILRDELTEARAARAAAGWGNDRLVKLVGNGTGFVWVTRWDDRANATQFERALRTYLSETATVTNGTWRRGDTVYRTVRLSDRTMALVVGSGTVVTQTTVTGAGPTVQVDVGS